jgi:hypothetical protein
MDGAMYKRKKKKKRMDGVTHETSHADMQKTCLNHVIY